MEGRQAKTPPDQVYIAVALVHFLPVPLWIIIQYLECLGVARARLAMFFTTSFSFEISKVFLFQVCHIWKWQLTGLLRRLSISFRPTWNGLGNGSTRVWRSFRYRSIIDNEFLFLFYFHFTRPSFAEMRFCGVTCVSEKIVKYVARKFSLDCKKH